MEIKILNENYATVIFEGKNGEKISKTITLRSLIACLQRSEGPMESEFMAPGVFKVFKSSRYELYWVLFNATIMDLRIQGIGSPRRCYIPRVVAQFKFNVEGKNRRLYSTNLFTLDDGDIFDRNVKLYNFPFNNYSPNFTSGVCWGDSADAVFSIINGEEVDTFKFDVLYRLFFGSVFNDHLGGYGSPNFLKIKAILDEKFPNKDDWQFRNSKYFYAMLEGIAMSNGELSYNPSSFMDSPLVFQSLEDMIQAGIDSVI